MRLGHDEHRRFAAHFRRLYGAERTPRLVERLAAMVGRYGVGVGEIGTAAQLDEREVVLITYGNSLLKSGQAPLQTLRRFAEASLRDAVSTIHVLPFCPYSSDDGFSVIDYRAVNSELGSWKDLRELGKHFRLMFDLVLNHCSRKSAWFRDYAQGIAPERDFFIECDPEIDLSAVVRPRTSPLLSSVDTRDGERHVWTTFSRDQVDLDFQNPDVLFEFLDILLRYIAEGARIIRLDAIAYLWKEIGTSCIHLPETHEVVKLFRSFVDLVAPELILLTETNVPHEENVSYFGEGDEARMVYQFSLPPLLLHALTTGDGTTLRDWLRKLAPPPAGATFLNFTASHDGIGVRPLEGLVADEELAALAERIRATGGEVSSRAVEGGGERPYELNATYFDALGEPGDQGSARHLARYLASQTIAMALQGVPAVYIHSLFGTSNDAAAVRRTGERRAINRSTLRVRRIRELLKDEDSITARVFGEMTRRLAIRRAHAAFHPEGAQELHETDPGLLAFERRAPDGSETILALQSLTSATQSVPPELLGEGWAEDLLTPGRPISKHELLLDPYEGAWLRRG